MIYLCCEENRRSALKGNRQLNGIDYLEIDRRHQGEHHPTLLVYLINPARGRELTRDNVQIAGGDAVRDVAAVEVRTETRRRVSVLHVRLNKRGDSSTYTLRLVHSPHSSRPPGGFDPILSSIGFSFRADSGDGVDCLAPHICPPQPQLDEPKIDYLAKDFNSFNQLMLDRLSLLIPGWPERHPADAGVAVVELLAYVGDHLSYQQDVIATEAYLDTARMRISARRHARLVDYFMHDGCNARTWVYVEVASGTVSLPARTALLTRREDLPTCVPPGSNAVEQAFALGAAVFETMHDATLYHAHNEIFFYTWGEGRCCLPAGATSATLCDDEQERLSLRAGDVLIFEELLGPQTGNAADADLTHRHAVRLTSVIPQATISPVDGTRTPGKAITDPLTGHPIVEVAWGEADALPFPLCISSRTDPGHGSKDVANVSVARGNIVLADHGMTILNEQLPDVPPATTVWIDTSNDRCAEPEAVATFARYRPPLQEHPLTQTGLVAVSTRVGGRRQLQQLPFDPGAPAAAAFQWQMRDVLPAISLQSDDGAAWSPQRDLLASDPSAHEFVAEVDDSGNTKLRFGDGRYGARPAPRARLTATYRVGNGSAGNIGLEALAHIVTDSAAIDGVRNPLAARGGTDPEEIEEVRQRAPSAYIAQERAVTEADYEAAAQEPPQVLGARARFVWTGSWRTVFLTVEPTGGAPVNAAFKTVVRRHLDRLRLAGYDIQIDGPTYVPLEIDATIWVQPDYFRADVRSALSQVLTSGLGPDGKPGVFYPDNFTFGQPVYLSPLYAAAQAVPGVGVVEVTKFQRLDAPTSGPPPGKIAMGALEMARLDTEANVPERGILRLTVRGGK